MVEDTKRSITVNEHIKILNIYYMLAYAFQALRNTGVSEADAESFENIHELFAAILARGISNQVRRGLYRSYVPMEEPLSAVRGRIDITATVKQQTLRHRRLVCRYDEFSADTDLNRILKFTMQMLLRHGNIRSDIRGSLRHLLPFFDTVSEIDPLSIRWKSIIYNRNNRSYELLMNVCWMTLTGLLQTTSTGAHRLSSFLDDQHMHKLYEKFVLSYYQREHPQYHASASPVDWDIAEGEDRSFLPAMRTDVTLRSGERTLIIDTKYYSHTMQHNPLYDSKSLISGNLYQIFAYVKNADTKMTGLVNGVLLYAGTDEEIQPDCEYTIGGNRIAAKTLNLNSNWQDICEQLDSLAETYL